MANLEVPGWARAERAKDWETMNRIVIKDLKGAARGLQQAWGRGGPRGVKGVTEWDGWFQNLFYRIDDLFLQQRLSVEAELTALTASSEILQARCPHWDHVDNIQAIKSLLRPNQAWNDYPIRPEEDEEEPM